LWACNQVTRSEEKKNDNIVVVELERTYFDSNKAQNLLIIFQKLPKIDDLVEAIQNL